jgi:hypothetical protein
MAARSHSVSDQSFSAVLFGFDVPIIRFIAEIKKPNAEGAEKIGDAEEALPGAWGRSGGDTPIIRNGEKPRTRRSARKGKLT